MQRATTGLVLSGGGVRGAYEVGVLLGLRDVLGTDHRGPSPFQIFAGTSIGAVNAAVLAANSHRSDMGIDELVDHWRGLRLSSHLRLRPWALLPGFLRGLAYRERFAFDRSLLDPRPLEDLVEAMVDWRKLADNIDQGHTQALLVPALDALRGRTVVFADLHKAASYEPSQDPRRTITKVRIGLDHIMASSSIPFFFPSRKIGDSFYFDGGLRFNTPIAPALRAGAERLLVVTLLRSQSAPAPSLMPTDEPSLTFLFGKLMNGLLLDPVIYDLQILDRLNRLVDVLDRALPVTWRQEFDRLMLEARGAPYRRVETLVFRPTVDIGRMAADFLRDNIDHFDLDAMERWMLRRLALRGDSWEADWATYVLFEGSFAEKLIEVGRRDVLGRADEVRRFFADDVTDKVAPAADAPADAGAVAIADAS